jgi:hypothetical protein
VAQEELGAKTTQALDDAVEAFQQGRLAESLRFAETVLQSASPDQLPNADQRLREEHKLDMSLVGLATFCRAELVLSGQGARLGRPPAAELPAALEALDDRIAFLLEPVRRELEIGMPAIIPDDVLTEKIDAIRPMLTQIDQAALLQSHINQLANRIPAADRGKLDERPRDIARRKLPDEQKKLEQLRDRVTTRLVDFSLVRLNNSLNTLVDDRANFQNRFTATQKAGESLATLHTNWDRYKRAKQRTGGLDANVEQRWRRQEELVRINSGPLLLKVHHLDQGLRWWLRGRFGQGPLAGGLVKLVPSGLGHDQAMQWLGTSPLMMPRVIRKPQNPLTVPAAFPIARRHLEVWRAESRISVQVGPQFIIARPDESMANTALLAGSEPLLSFGQVGYSFRYLENRPEEMHLAQLVGFVEYAMALAHFERLVELATPAELRTFDDLVGQDDRFVVHSHLSAKFDGLDAASSLRLPRQIPDPRAAHANERRGLAWLMALARVELGAMRASQSVQPGNPYVGVDSPQRFRPSEIFGDPYSSFDRWPPTAFDRAAFVEIVFDGGRQHYYESRTEYQISMAAVPELLSPQARIRLLQLERKLHIGIELLEAFRNYSAGTLTAAQQMELNRWLSRLATQDVQIRMLLYPPPPIVGEFGVQRQPGTAAQPDQRHDAAEPRVADPGKGVRPQRLVEPANGPIDK